MLLNEKQLTELALIAEKAACTAAKYISSQAAKSHKSSLKSGGESLATQVVTAVDRQSERLIMEVLGESMVRYDLGLLTEESKDDGSRFAKDYFWCIDPLDGTLPFTEHQPGYAVSVALVSKAGESLIGVVVDPYDQEIYKAVKGRGFLLNGMPLHFESQAGQPLVCHFDRSFENAANHKATVQALNQVSHNLGYEGLQISSGPGAVLNALGLLDRHAGCYFKLPKANPGGGCIWDFAATSLMFAELGLHVSDIKGNPLMLNNQETLYMNKTGVIYATDLGLGRAIVEMCENLSE